MTATPTIQPTRNPAVRTQRRRRIGVAITVALGTIGIASTAAAHVLQAPTDLPPWTVCEYRDMPPAADLGPLLPVNYDPPEEVKRVLLGEIDVGTDCSIYDLSVFL